jgi:hypothetical protein
MIQLTLGLSRYDQRLIALISKAFPKHSQEAVWKLVQRSDSREKETLSIICENMLRPPKPKQDSLDDLFFEEDFNG